MEREANASAAPAGPPPAAAEQAGASRGEARSGRLLMRGSWHIALIALVLGLLAAATFFAQRQPPHPDMLRPVGDWDLTSAQWWGYPLERNAFKRRVVRGDLFAVFTLPNTQKLWVVGRGGLILHSGDDGVTWVQQRPVVAAAEPEVASRRVGAAWSLLGTAVAQQAADTKGAPANAAAQQPSADSPYSSGAAAGPASAAPTRPAQVAIPSPSGVSRKLAGALPEADQQAPVKRKAKAATAAARASARAARTAAPAPGIAAVQADLKAVFFVDELVGWAVGDDGTILDTRDGGANWEAQKRSSAASLNSVQFNSDGKRGWVVGESGTILATRDGGASWAAQKSGSTADLASVIFNNDGRRGWAVGDGGTILATANGGVSWAAQTSGSASLLTSVEFNSDGLRGWTVDDEGVIRATDNGGVGWVDKTLKSPKWRLSSVHFNSDGQRGWAVGYGGDIGTRPGARILSSRDGGENWVAQTSDSSLLLLSVQFNSDGQRGWAVGDHGTILATRDGGASWVAQTSGDAAQLANVQLSSDGQRGWAVAEGGTILATINGGASWAAQSSGSTKRLASVHFNNDGQRGWAVGSGSTILATANGGATWAAQPSGSTAYLTSVHFNRDGQRGWVVGDEGTILATRDGGSSWAAQTSGSASQLMSAHFISNGQRGWAVGVGGTIFATRNGGVSWAAQTSGSKVQLNSLQFNSDGQRGWAVGLDGTILTSRNGGDTWTEQTSGSTAHLTSALFNNDDQRGWAVGSGGTILATANGGATWAAQPSNSTSDLTSVQFNSDGLQGLVVGHDGTVLTTTDGGKVWTSAAHYQRFWPPWYAAALLLLSIALFALLGLVEPVKKGATANDRDEPAPGGAATLLRSDQPVADKRFDRLGVGPAVEALSSFIRNPETEPRVTLAVTGEWGNGKSSVMRMLQTELEHAGFRSAWFNAWHHQQEGRQLSALFNVVRQQAVPAVWRQPFGALRVRSRLIWGRGGFYKTVAVVSAATLALLLGDMLANGPVKAFDHIVHNFSHHLLQQRQTAITGASLAKLNPFAKPVASAASGAASPASAAADPAKPGRAKPVLIEAAAPPNDPCQDKALLLATRIAEPVRPELYCYMLQNLQWDEGGDSSRCGVQHKPAVEPARRCVFASAHDLIATLEARGTGGPHRLWPSEKKAVLAAAETLPPPAVFPWLEQSLLGGLAGLLALAFGKGIAVYGVQLTAPLRALLAAGSGDANAGKEVSGTIER